MGGVEVSSVPRASLSRLGHMPTHLSLGRGRGCHLLGWGRGTYMEKLVMKAFLGSSIWKVTSCIESALLTTRLVTTVWAKRDETLESTVRL